MVWTQKRRMLFALVFLGGLLHGALGVSLAREKNLRSPLAVRAGPTVSREQRENTMRDVVQAFTAAGVQFVACMGTALGITREGKLLEQDDDVDFCVTDDTFDLARPALDKIRPDLVRIPAGDPRNFHQLVAHGWGPADIYRLTATNPNRLQGNETDLLCSAQDLLVIPNRLVFPAKFVQPSGIPVLQTVPVPLHVEEHLAWRYGADWRKPKKGTKAVLPASVTEQYNRLCRSPPSSAPVALESMPVMHSHKNVPVALESMPVMHSHKNVPQFDKFSKIFSDVMQSLSSDVEPSPLSSALSELVQSQTGSG